MKTMIVLLWVVVAAVVARPQDTYDNQAFEGQLAGHSTSAAVNLDNQVSESQVGQKVKELVRASRALYGNQGGSGGGSQGGGFPSAPASYNFQWDVNDQPSGNVYGHGEERDGDNTQGNYYVQLPDSRRLQVEYFVDQSGYHPTVTFEGEAQFPSGGGGGGSSYGGGAGSGGGAGQGGYY